MDLSERGRQTATRHPWEVARSRFFLGLLSRFGALEGTTQWLDVGAGDAWLGDQLRDALSPRARVVCWDINYATDDLASSQPGAGVELTAERPVDRFDGVLLLDVIEHVADDQGFVADIVGNLMSVGGWVLASVPAYPILFSDHDRRLRHFRRYRPRQFGLMLQGAGLEMLARGGVFHSLAAVRTAEVVRERATGRPASPGGVGDWQHSRPITALVTSALTAEVRLSMALGMRGRGLPGLSCWFLGRRADK